MSDEQDENQFAEGGFVTDAPEPLIYPGDLLLTPDEAKQRREQMRTVTIYVTGMGDPHQLAEQLQRRLKNKGRGR